MRSFQRHRRSLTWIASLSSAAVLASFGATAVLAEGPACTVNGTAVTQEQYASDNSLCPNGPDAPQEPAPTEPKPVEPAPIEPVEPAPVEPAPVEPVPVDPAPTEPAPVDPAPQTTTPADPVAQQPTGTTPRGATPPAADPTTAAPGDAKPVSPKPAKPTPTKPATKPVRNPGSSAPGPQRPAPQQDTAEDRNQALLQAKKYQAAPFRDARLFREQFTPAGRIPTQPELEAERAQLLFDAASGTGTSWSLLTAVAWLESRWGDPSAGGLVGRRLSDAAWAEYATDGDDDGAVKRSSAADQAATVATFLAEARSSKGAALEAYFSGSRREVMAERAVFLAHYFDALGKVALVKGLDDPQARAELEERLLANEDVDVYDGGRSDIGDGLVDPRVLVTIEFLANRFDTVTVSSLISGHGVYTSGGNVSLHSYGQAVDIAALDDESVLGNQQKDGNTYRAVQEILLLPKAMQPAELISLWDMGGPSFAMADHHDHIHAGWKTEPVPTFGQDDHEDHDH